MIQINLLPIRQMKERAAAKQQLVLFGFSLLILIALLAAGGMVVISMISGLNQDISDLDKEKTRLDGVLKLIKELDEKKALVNNQTEVVKNLKKNSSLTVRVLDDVANITPHKRMWLTNFDQTGSTLKLTGMALDNQTVARYLDDLKTSRFIDKTSVALQDTNLSAYGGKNLKSFNLSCAVFMPAAPGEKAAEAKTETK